MWSQAPGAGASSQQRDWDWDYWDWPLALTGAPEVLVPVVLLIHWCARWRITCLCCHAGLTGVPQVSIPGGEIDGHPIGLSIIAARGADETLVAVARALEEDR